MVRTGMWPGLVDVWRFMVWSAGLVAEGAVVWRFLRARWCGLKVW